MIFIGIDPGLTGALATIYTAAEPVSYRVWDAPTGKTGKSTVLLPQEMRTILIEALRAATLSHDGRCHVYIERVHSMPKQGVASSFNFGMGYGIWIGLIQGLQIPMTFVTPNAWKKEMMAGMPKEKDASRIRAQELFPDADLHLKKHHGRSDALLIAEYGRSRAQRAS